MKGTFTACLMLFCWHIGAQSVTDFENFNLPAGAFLNGSDGNGGFSSGYVFLPNAYEGQFMSWSGWAISTMTDVTTPGFTNQYSAIAGSGADSSSHYAVTYAFGNNNLILNGMAAGKPVLGMYVTNSTYAYLSMLEGDAFSKKFGGVTGNDPDFFLLTIRAWHNGTLSADSVKFYLADYRFADNNQDYIVDAWTWVDLSGIGAADSLSFNLSSSDVGIFGMNTPAYFCIDQVKSSAMVGVNDGLLSDGISVYPNPATDFLQILAANDETLTCTVYDMQGKLVFSRLLDARGGRLDLQMIPTGNYRLTVQSGHVWYSKLIIKH